MLALSSNNKDTLLRLSRESIASYFTGQASLFRTDDPELLQKAGCFITLRRQGLVRGCIGTFDSDISLYQNAERMSRAAAFQDRRFSPLLREELSQIRISVSVMTEPKRVEDFNSLELGRHGVIVKHGKRSGTLLPDVALEQGWNLQQYVLFCAREKAGLKPAEIAQAEIHAYEVIKFSEPD